MTWTGADEAQLLRRQRAMNRALRGATCGYGDGADPVMGYPRCDAPATHLVTYRNGSYGPYTMRVCGPHVDAARGRFWPVDSVTRIEGAIGRELAEVDADQGQRDPLTFRPFEPRTVGGGDGQRRYAVIDTRTGEAVARCRRWAGAVDEARQRNDAHEDAEG